VTPVVVDSSVALKWFVPEVLADRAERLLDGSYELLAPDLLIPECGNVIWKKVARGELRIQEGRDILAALRTTPLRIVASTHLVEAALEIAHAFRRSVYDALYVALAVARGGVLATADDHLARALGESPLAGHVRSLRDWGADRA
jgi:predicted nucleic acid-binding protein